jgi:hypothetical protein
MQYTQRRAAIFVVSEDRQREAIELPNILTEGIVAALSNWSDSREYFYPSAGKGD